eukprot:SAG11_NODE_35553_length_266_cov_0.610778_1_plen_57_part_10
MNGVGVVARAAKRSAYAHLGESRACQQVRREYVTVRCRRCRDGPSRAWLTAPVRATR